MKITKLSREMPTKKVGSRTVVIEAGLPKDRLKGYRDDRTGFKGSDARAALVGEYQKKKGRKSGGY